MIAVHQLTLNDQHFVYRTCGEGPDLFMIHGWLSSGRMWEETMQVLAERYRVWAIDLIGFGDSRTHDQNIALTIDQQTTFVEQFLQAVGLRPYAVIGHSMGGAITLKLALNQPALVPRLALVCAVITGSFHFNIGQLLSMPTAQRTASRLEWIGASLWPHMKNVPAAHVLLAPSYLPPHSLHRTIEDYRKATWRATYDALLSMMHIRLDTRLDTIQQPTFIMTGSQDITVPPEDSRLAAKLIPASTFVEISSCHHHIPDEIPNLFTKILGDFLDSADYDAYWTAH